MKRNEIERLLPRVYQDVVRPATPLWALLQVMQSLHEPAEEILAQVETTFSPYRMPERFVPYVARWLDLDRFFPATKRAESGTEPGTDMISSGNGQLRELIAAAAYLSQWRGTAQGLRLFLEIATGSAGFELDEQVKAEDGAPRPYHIGVSAPLACVRHRALIERIIELEKPAYVTYELVFV